MQQQFGYYVGPLGDKIATILSLFKECGGKSERYQNEVAQLPANAASHLNAAIQDHIKTVQQQQQQLQM